jgi:hypothetical protein
MLFKRAPRALLLVSLSCAFGASARAEEKKPGFCRPGSAVAAKAADCEENSVFAAQAKECREALGQEVARASGALAKLIGQGGAGSQSGNFGATAKDYGTSAAELTRLIGLATLAAADLDSYLDWVVLPEDVDNPEIAGNDMQKYAESIGCFGNNVKAIRGEIEAVNGMRAQLEAARAASGALGATAGKAGESIKASPAPAAPAATGGVKQAGPPDDFKGAYRPGQSDISGTEDKKK